MILGGTIVVSAKCKVEFLRSNKAMGHIVTSYNLPDETNIGQVGKIS